MSVGLALAWHLAVTSGPARAQTAGAASTPSASPAVLVPPMFGDFIGVDPEILGVRRQQPLAATYSAFKVVENESPLPMDRLFVTYNFYSGVLGTQDIHRESLGVEKTVLQGNASLGLRLPFYQINSDNGPDSSKVDDLTLLFKYAVLRAADGALSTGLAVTLPTGPSYQPAAAHARTVAQLQPFIGYLWRSGDFYLHGFLSVAVPTDAVAPTVLFNDIGIGYRLPVGGAPARRHPHIRGPREHAPDPPERR